MDSATIFFYWFINALLVGIGAPTQLVWVEPVIPHSSAFGRPPLLPARREAAGGEKLFFLRAAVVHSHALHPHKVGGDATLSIVVTCAIRDRQSGAVPSRPSRKTHHGTGRAIFWPDTAGIRGLRDFRDRLAKCRRRETQRAQRKKRRGRGEPRRWGKKISESYITVGLKKHARVCLPFSGILSVLCVPPPRTLRLMASHLAKPLRK